MMSEEASGSILGLVILGVIGFGLYAYFDKKPSETDPKQQQQQQAQEIKQLQTKIAELEKKPEHHYELRTLGFRTWRFDPATGNSCIQFSTPADWKKSETIRQGCEYQDMVSDTTEPNAWYQAECLLVNNKTACDHLVTK
jgi:hypothetical protein